MADVDFRRNSVPAIEKEIDGVISWTCGRSVSSGFVATATDTSGSSSMTPSQLSWD
jgi:hypothetical protein